MEYLMGTISEFQLEFLERNFDQCVASLDMKQRGNTVKNSELLQVF